MARLVRVGAVGVNDRHLILLDGRLEVFDRHVGVIRLCLLGPNRRGQQSDAKSDQRGSEKLTHRRFLSTNLIERGTALPRDERNTIPPKP